jgi:hypothetical protein
VDFGETSEYRALRTAVADIARDFGPAYYIAHAAERKPCDELWAALGEAGFIGVNIPAEHGGGGGGLTELALVCEEIAAQGTPLLLLVSAAICAEVISEFGTDEQRKTWLPGLAAGTSKVVFAITEPDAGSNTHRLATTAVRVEGDGEAGGGWRLSGTKYYISGVDEADALLVVARTGAAGDSGDSGDVGATTYILRGFDPQAWLDLIEREQITQVFGLPMVFRAALDHPTFGDHDLSSLRRAVYAMAPMPDALIRRCLDQFGCDFALLFGQTEMAPCATLFRPEHQLTHIGAVGTPLTGVQVAIMDPQGRLLPPGELGEIVYRGSSTMQGYLNNPEATDVAFAHGWFHSGDVGRFGDDGVLWFADRYKDVIKTGGENVASIEVEKAIYAAEPGIAEAVVVGLPHERWSEAITAVVVPKPGEHIDPGALIAALKDRLDPYKVPKSVIVAGELPKTSTGKIQKNLVREQHAAHYGG